MSTLTLGDYNAGTDTLSAWTNPSYAWDGNIDTFASLYNPNASKTLVFTGRSDSCPDYIITKVEIGFYHYESTPTLICSFKPVFGGTTYGDQKAVSNKTIAGWTWVNITTGTNAPSPWTHTDIDGLDIEYYSAGTIPTPTIYISAVAIRIEYTPAEGPTNLKTINGLAKASVKTIKGLAIGSVKSWNGLT